MIYEKTLSNGLEIVVQPTSSPVASVHVWVDVGSIDEKPLEAGYCHFLEHMLFKGTSKRSTSQIAGVVEGAGGEMNAFTSFEYTVYHITLSNQRWELANEILGDMVLNSTFEPKEFNPEKEVIIEEIRRSEDSADRQLYMGAYQALYGTKGYGRPVIGFPTTVRNCTAGGLKSFWKKWYTPSLMTIVICGDVDPMAVFAHSEKIWGKVKERNPQRRRRRETGYNQTLANSYALASSRNFPINSVRWLNLWPACNLLDPDLPALDLAAMILGQGEASRLYRKLFQEEQLVTSIGAGLWAPVGTGMLTIEAEVPIEKTSKFRSSVSDEVLRFTNHGVDKHELERVKNVLESDRTYSTQTMDALAHRLGYLKTSMGNVRFDLDYLNQIRETGVDDIQLVAQKYFKSESTREFALIPKNFETSKLWGTNKQVQATKKTEKNSAKVKLKQTVTQDASEKISLSNGIDLLLFPRADLPIVSFQSCSLGGLRFENENNCGIGNLISDVWEKGPRDWDSKKFVEFLENHGAKIEAFSGRNSLGIAGSTLSSKMSEVLPIFIDSIFNPAFSSDEFDRSRNVAIEDLTTFDDEPGRLVSRMFYETLFEGHPYQWPILGTLKSVKTLTNKDIQSHHKKLFLDSKVVVSVCGKFQPEKILKAFEKVKRADITIPKLNGEVTMLGPKSNRQSEVKKNREQSHLILGYLGLSINDLDRYALKLLLTVLGGQSGRLFRELRDKKGLCYTVAPISFEGLGGGYVGVYMGCDPSKRTEGLIGIRNELQKIVSRGITEVELKRAKEFVLGRHLMDLQLSSSLATVSSFSHLYGLDYVEHLKWSEQLKPITSASVKRLATRLFTQSEILAMVV